MPERVVITDNTLEEKKMCPNSYRQKSDCKSSGSSADRILQLQRSAGNKAVQRLIKSETSHAKLRTGHPDGGILPGGTTLDRDEKSLRKTKLIQDEVAGFREVEDLPENVLPKFLEDTIIKQCEDPKITDKTEQKEKEKTVDISSLLVFNQNNYPDVKLGNFSLKNVGCLVTSLTMVANALGVDYELTPDKAAEKLKFTSTGALTGGIASIGLKEDKREEKSELFIQTIDKELEKKTNPGLIIQIDYLNDEKGDHFVQVRSKKNGRYFTADPAFGALISFKLDENGVMSDIQDEAANKFYTKKKTPKVVKVIKYSALG